MPNGRSILRRSLTFMTPVMLTLVGIATALAQSAPDVTAHAETKPAETKPAETMKPASKTKSHSVPGSPLDTLRSTHLYTKVAPAKDFVKDSRPDPKTLGYVPLTGTDPERPKPRDAANVLALQAELERSRGVNEGKGKAFGTVKKARKAAR